ncbi:hypothetical protein AMAG_19393 [Allomyces macrogynus ATCC 38327]|uniref:Peptidase M1 membrane alanine aminopeptidase domain-containing protein n=1 Tax=Allomyces macrogynus (strain ATCC 38327) TaxID=578462 RepID=A0A0L0SQS6_ALLM3|nr:hypothetical protein AMAG_19393 [Allomyces macrogynus ATCC 38327]|eukprot:KNE64893.1 hypothetical protein AMAG_19393 [Allomyces macrogynus ATCC 38327]
MDYRNNSSYPYKPAFAQQQPQSYPSQPTYQQQPQPKEGTFALPAKPTAVPVDFYKLNLDQANFYRVQYAAADLARLGEAVEHGLVPTADRVGLVSDVFALAAAGYSSTVDALALLSHFKGEQEYIVLEAIAAKLSQVKTVWAMEPEPQQPQPVAYPSQPTYSQQPAGAYAAPGYAAPVAVAAPGYGVPAPAPVVPAVAAPIVADDPNAVMALYPTGNEEPSEPAAVADDDAEAEAAPATPPELANPVVETIESVMVDIGTLQWWNELWLNEGFATYVGWLAIARHLFPEWHSFVAFVGDDMARALTLDALRSSHPIEVPVKAPSEISQIFDAISYSKGASVIRMLSSWLTEDVFLAGVRKYIQRFKYRNAATTDLWAALSEASGMDVGQFMALWTQKVGYPVISAERQGNAVTVKQARFLSTGDATADEDETVWWCPLAPYVGGEPTNSASAVLKQKEGTFALPAKPTAVPVDFYKLNLDQANFYRVQPGMQVRHEYIVLEAIAAKLSQVKTVWAMEPEPVADQLAALQRSIFAPTAHAMGWEYPDGESHLDGLKRQLAIGQAGMAGDKELVAQAKARFARFIQGDTHAIHPNLRGAVYAIVLRHSSVSPAAKGGEPHSAELEAVKAIWENESTPMDQRLAALGALGHVQDSTLLAGLLEYAMDESKVRPQDVMYPLRSVAANAPAGQLTKMHLP